MSNPARKFLNVVARSMPGTCTAQRMQGMDAYARSLAAEFLSSDLTDALARAVGPLLGDSFPTYDQLADAVRKARASGAGGSRPATGSSVARGWENFMARRLADGADRGHLLSLLQAQCPPEHFRAVMQAVFPAELDRLDAREREAARDKAAVRGRLEAVRRRMTRLPAGPHGPTIHTRPVPARPLRHTGHLDGEALAQARSTAAAKGGIGMVIDGECEA